MPRTKVVKEELPPHPLVSQIGKLVRYYDEGFRYGYLEEVKNKTCSIRAIVYKGTAARCMKIPIQDVYTSTISTR